MEYIAVECKRALNKIANSKLPYDYDLNIYRGCEHSCQYCYAIYSHSYLEGTNFFETIYYKKNIVKQLEKELSSRSWKKDVINMGGVCDSYQPIEKELELTREVLKVMLKYENPIIISTKSTLILRDIDLLKELSEKTYVSVAFTITSPLNKYNSLLEPNAPEYLERFKALKELKKAGIPIGLHIMPVVPYLNSDLKSMEYLFKLAAQIEVDHIIIGMLNLRGETRKHFLKFIKDNLPKYYDDIFKYFNNRNIKSKFNREFYQEINKLIRKYDLNTNYFKRINDYKEKQRQQTIFEYIK